MRSGWNPTRRNRNIGTAKQGRGQANQLVIPKAWPDDRVFWEVLNKPVAIPAQIGDCQLTFLIEPPRLGCFYPCTIDDVKKVLECVPQEDLDGIELIIFRQPTRKQSRLNPVWGRFLYYAVPGSYSGTAICIEAHDLSESWKWPLSLSPDSLRELIRLQADGHRIEQSRRGYIIHRTAESVRGTVLFRTLFHEIGHYVDWLQSVIRPTMDMNNPLEEARLYQEFDSKPSKNKEDFAHRYAQKLATQLRNVGEIPFPPQLDAVSIVNYGLSPDWFRTPVVNL